MRIAFLMSADMRADNPDRRIDGYEHDLEFTALQREGADRNIVFEEVIWEATDVDWRRFDGAMVGTTWDYAQKREAFFEALAIIDQEVPLFNPLALMQWNADKTYLRDLAAKGVPTIETLWADAARPEIIASAFDTLKTDSVVIKPRIGASGWRQKLLKRGETLPPADVLPPAACLIQPFLPSVMAFGEISLLYYDGVFSHCARKTPGAGDYRIQSIYGGREQVHTPNDQDFACAEAAIAALPLAPLYARIDIIRDTQNQPLIIEVELIEPYHYVEQGPGFAAPLIDGMVKRLA